jgi:hypothetical protein
MKTVRILFIWIVILSLAFTILNNPNEAFVTAAFYLTYAGYNTLFYLDSLFEIKIDPIIVWALWGMIFGILFGVIIAVKKLNLSKLLILPPIGFVALLFLLMAYINSPQKVSGAYIPVNIENELDDTEIKPSGIINAELGVNVRSGPGMNFSVVTTLSKNQRVTILEGEPNENWYKISFVQDNQTFEGWIFHSLIEKE